MKVGLSYSRCILDLVKGNVRTEDVLVIIARTKFDPRDDNQWNSIWSAYCGGGTWHNKQEWHEYDVDNVEHEKLFRDKTLEIYESGRLHQPRNFGASVRRLPYYWLEVGIPSEEIEKNPVIKKAWEQFIIISGLSSTQKFNSYNDDF